MMWNASLVCLVIGLKPSGQDDYIKAKNREKEACRQQRKPSNEPYKGSAIRGSPKSKASFCRVKGVRIVHSPDMRETDYGVSLRIEFKVLVPDYAPIPDLCGVHEPLRVPITDESKLIPPEVRLLPASEDVWIA